MRGGQLAGRDLRRAPAGRALGRRAPGAARTGGRRSRLVIERSPRSRAAEGVAGGPGHADVDRREQVHEDGERLVEDVPVVEELVQACAREGGGDGAVARWRGELAEARQASAAAGPVAAAEARRAGGRRRSGSKGSAPSARRRAPERASQRRRAASSAAICVVGEAEADAPGSAASSLVEPSRLGRATARRRRRCAGSARRGSDRATPERGDRHHRPERDRDQAADLERGVEHDEQRTGDAAPDVEVEPGREPPRAGAAAGSRLRTE